VSAPERLPRSGDLYDLHFLRGDKQVVPLEAAIESVIGHAVLALAIVGLAVTRAQRTGVGARRLES
jgi:hypothetical protein